GPVPGIYTVTATTVQSTFSALITYSSTAALVVNTGVWIGGPPVTIIVPSTRSGTDTALNTNGPLNFVYVGSGTLDGIQGPLTVGGTLINVLSINDQGTGVATAYTLKDHTIDRSGAALITYQNAVGLVLNAGSGGNTITVPSAL